ncbi:hypothetical protein Z950_2769 [Sulfitobacter mediterraneus KCTC 32188]|nr:hypothetical protein Z950_2769 [Sulfitobacter mediterraneus KCTC 32188]
MRGLRIGVEDIGDLQVGCPLGLCHPNVKSWRWYTGLAGLSLRKRQK